MHLSFEIASPDLASFLRHWASKYAYPLEEKYTLNIRKPLTTESLRELFEWKNGSKISKRKTQSIADNYGVSFLGDRRARYLSHKAEGGAIWNIFYLHCLDPDAWPIFDQHTFRAMKYMQTGKVVEIGSTDKQRYAAYESEYIPFFNSFGVSDHRMLDKALFSYGKFLKLAARYA